MTVERYKIHECGDDTGDCYVEMNASDNGSWVKHSDYAALLSKYEALREKAQAVVDVLNNPTINTREDEWLAFRDAAEALAAALKKGEK